MQKDERAQSIGADEMLSDALDASRPLAEPLRAAIRPLADQRSRLREVLAGLGALKGLPQDDGSYLSLAAVDGAHAVTPLFVGDQINVLALAVQSDLGTGDIAIQGHRSFNHFLPHSPGNEVLAKAAMFAAELELLGSVVADDVVTVVDGSHLTAAIAISEALVSSDMPAHDYICDETMSYQIIAAVKALASRDDVVACPKSDSSTELSEFLELQGAALPLRFPDKVLASLVLNEGEVLALPQSEAPWDKYDLISQQITSSGGIWVRKRLDEAFAPLREGLRVAHVKPWGSSTAIRVETKASMDDFVTMDYWQALADDCEPPHTQEPVAQYIADHLAKGVSQVARVQLDTARLDLAESADDGLVEFLVRSYRTT